MSKCETEETPYRVWRDSKTPEIEEILEGMDDMKRLKLYDLVLDAFCDGQIQGIRQVGEGL
jgi:hypothetical protein